MIFVGTIKTAIALYDGVTSPLQSMHKAMGVVLNTFESMQKASGNAVDIASIRTAREEWAKAGTAFDSIEQKIKDADQQQQKFNQSLRGGSSATDGLLSKIKSMAAAVGGALGAKKIVDLSDQLTSSKARLNLLVEDGWSVEALEQKVMASAQRSRSAYFDTASAVAKLGMNAKDAFGGMDEVIGFSELINKQFVISGATAQEQSAAMLQLTQAMSSGVLRGDELRSVFEQAPGIIQNIADYLNVPIGKIRDMAAEGEITADIVKKATFAASDNIESRFESMPMTWEQIWTSMKNKALSVFSPILNKINELMNSEKFSQVTDGIINGFTGTATIASGVINLLVNGAAWVVDNWDWIAPIVMGVAGAFLILHGAMIAYNAVQAISNGLKAISAARSAIKSGLTLAEAAATTTATGAQVGLNAALLACPITWILLIIIAVIAAIYAIVAAINKVTGSTLSATGIICGALAVAGAFIVNLVVGVLNGMIQLLWTIFVEPFLGIIEWILNVCTGGFDSFGGAVANLIGNIISWFMSLGKVVTKIIDAIFGTDWTGGLNALQDKVLAWGKTENSVTLDRNAPTINYRMEYGSAWDSGYGFGEGIADKVSGMFNFEGKDPMGASDLAVDGLGTTLDNIYNSADNTAANTAATADALDIAEEDLAYLRDIAEREAINRFTTAEIHVEQTNHNNISSDTDLDGIMDAWANNFAEKLDVSEEGVHV